MKIHCTDPSVVLPFESVEIRDASIVIAKSLGELAHAPGDAARLLLTHAPPPMINDAIEKELVHRVIDEINDLVLLEAQQLHTILKQRRELANLAITDPVTLLRNHRYFQDQLKVEIARASRHGRAMALIMLDIDHFKEFNDQHGHPAGDRLLREMSKRLVEAVRTLDTVSRYGGEEFAIVLPDTALQSAVLVAERVRESVANTPFNVVGGTSTIVTISLGVASVPTHATDHAALVEAADKALYRAKSQGRNQSVVAPGVSP